jgi:hypothetical protein
MDATVGEKTGNAAVDCNGKKKRDESENEDIHRITSEEDQQEEGREDQPKSKKTISQSIVRLKIGDAQISRELINQFRAERDTALKELKDAIQKMLKDTDSQVRAMLQGCIHQH